MSRSAARPPATPAAAAPGRDVARRLAILYAAAFAVIGVQQPFWPVWLAAHGLGSGDIGVVLALSIGVKVISTPAVAHFADRSGERKRPMVALALVALAAFAAFGQASGFAAIVAVSLVYFAASPPIVTLAESVTLKAAGAGAADYGRVRLWGSLGFIAAATLAGQVLNHRPAGAVWWMILLLQGLVLAACWRLPDRRETAPPRPGMPLAETLADRRLRLALLACGLIQASHAVYYGFSTLAWRDAGHSAAVIGLLWAEAVLAEVVLFAFGSRLLGRIAPAPLIALAGAAATLRWIGSAFAEPLAALALLQLLHAFSFGAAHLAAMHFIAAEVAPGLAATAQSLYSGGVWGLFLGSGMLLAGFLFEPLATLAYLPMAALALAGGATAAWLASRPPAGAMPAPLPKPGLPSRAGPPELRG